MRKEDLGGRETHLAPFSRPDLEESRASRQHECVEWLLKVRGHL
jgi:hypothetical protein